MEAIGGAEGAVLQFHSPSVVEVEAKRFMIERPPRRKLRWPRLSFNRKNGRSEKQQQRSGKSDDFIFLGPFE